MKALLPTATTIEGFETDAWTVVSSSGLLIQTDAKALEEITEAYAMIQRANKYHDQIVEMSIGVASAIGGVGESRAKYLHLLDQTITELEPRLKTIAERAKSKS